MRRKTPALVLGAATFVAVALCGSTARAGPRDPVHVVADPAGVTCLDRSAFERALFARISRPRGNGASTETKVLVRIDVDGSGFAGHVTIAEPGEEPRERVVHGASCADVALSVVLVAALALGGEAEADPSRPRVHDPVDDAVDPRPPPPAPAATPWTPRVGAHAGLAGAGSGESSLGVDVFGELARLGSGVSPGLRLALAYATAARSESALTMRVSTLTARLEPSIVRVHAGPVAARLVLAIEGGAAFASASGAARTESPARPWLRAGAQGEVAVDLLGPVGLEAAAGALLAVVRDDFVVEPSGFGLRVPLIAPVGRLGFVVRLR